MPLKSILGLFFSHFRPTFFFPSRGGGRVRPGTTATHHLLPLKPITIKLPTTATTYYDWWRQWWLSVVGGMYVCLLHFYICSSTRCLPVHIGTVFKYYKIIKHNLSNTGDFDQV